MLPLKGGGEWSGKGCVMAVGGWTPLRKGQRITAKARLQNGHEPRGNKCGGDAAFRQNSLTTCLFTYSLVTSNYRLKCLFTENVHTERTM